MKKKISISQFSRFPRRPIVWKVLQYRRVPGGEELPFPSLSFVPSHSNPPIRIFVMRLNVRPSFAALNQRGRWEFREPSVSVDHLVVG